MLARPRIGESDPTTALGLGLLGLGLLGRRDGVRLVGFAVEHALLGQFGPGDDGLPVNRLGAAVALTTPLGLERGRDAQVLPADLADHAGNGLMEGLIGASPNVRVGQPLAQGVGVGGVELAHGEAVGHGN